ncbi:MAG: putative molybdenum carrier protein [Gammaproteobacteria bacterium]|nr:putative molybdenum carrier protein [Gammaproteobacteria bacterium]
MPDIAIQRLTRIISGGQSGVDRAALDIAIELDIPHGGWCPRGRMAEDGIIERCYQLKEADDEDYMRRTELNVRDSDGTLILNTGKITGGTALTLQFARQLNKPLLIINLDQPYDCKPVYNWLNRYEIEILNIAGPRESKHQGIYSMAERFLRDLFSG